MSVILLVDDDAILLDYMQAALRDDGHEAADSDLRPFLEHPLEVIFFEHALVERNIHRRLAAGRTFFDHRAARAFAGDLRQLDLVFPALVIQHDDMRAGPHPQHVAKLVRDSLVQRDSGTVYRLRMNKKPVHRLTIYARSESSPLICSRMASEPVNNNPCIPNWLAASTLLGVSSM